MPTQPARSKRAALFALILLGCRAKAPSVPSGAIAEQGTGLDANAREQDGTRAAPPTDPGPADPGFTLLEVPGFDSALVFLPGGREGKAPLVVVAHGAGVVPSDLCGVARRMFGGHAALLCLAGPRVAARSEGRYFPDHPTLERIFLASVEALIARYPGRVDGRDATYLGYSQGATMGALMLPAHGDLCSRLILVEGGFAEWTLARARRFRESGGRAVLLACGTRHCAKSARTSAALLRSAGLAAMVVSDLTTGHSYGGGLAAEVERAIPSFLQR